MGDSEYVLEFFIEYITCKNTSVRSSPLAVSFLGCPDMIINPKSATICKIVYNKGKRLKIPHTYLTDLKVAFILLYGHGEQTVRASCTLDFAEIADVSSNDPVPRVYSVEAGLNNIEGEPFGTLKLSFQLFPLQELQQIALSSAYQKARTTTSSRISVKSQPSSERQSAVSTPRSETYVPALPIGSQKCTSRSALGGSIHERYMARNENWMGHHCSTRTEGATYKISSRNSSRPMSQRSFTSK